MISKNDVKKLAILSRVEVADNELEDVAAEIESILAYVGQINTASASLADSVEDYSLVNVMREDSNPHTTGENTEILLNSAPQREGQYVKVKKILN